MEYVQAGVDIGTARIRVALARRSRKAANIEAIALRDIPSGVARDGLVGEPELVAALIDEMRVELGWNGRRAVCGVAPPAATLRSATFPKMSAFERANAARLDIERHTNVSLRDVAIRVHPAGAGAYRVGTVERAVLRSRIAVLGKARIRSVAVDYEGLALLRCHRNVDAVIDLGERKTALYVCDVNAPGSWYLPIGGSAITDAIAADLAIGWEQAEARKRLHGCAGAGSTASRGFVEEIAAMVAQARRRHRIERIATVGNASRLRGLRNDIERIAHVSCVDMEAPAERPCYAQDAASVAMTDWSLAVGLALWGS
jgi:Tfp pilus assembly PilM family ATPase